jgi:hypothetical protein
MLLLVLTLLWSGTVSFVLPLASSPPPRLHMQRIGAGADNLRWPTCFLI